MDKYLSVFTERMLPAYVSHMHPKFVQFCKFYFELLEQTDGVYDYAAHALEYMDIDKTKALFYDNFRQAFLAKFPEEVNVDLQFLVKNVIQYYRNKGNKDSLRFLFTLLTEETIEDIWYPRDYILHASYATWIKPVTMSFTAYYTATLEELVGMEVFGETSIARGIISDLSASNNTFPIYDATPTLFNVEMGNTLKFYNSSSQYAGIPFDEDGLAFYTADSTLYHIPTTSASYLVTLEEYNGLFQSGETLLDSLGADVLDVITYLELDGYWKNNKSKLSQEIVLQDNYFWQSYSYVIESDHDRYGFEDFVLEGLHPSGFIMHSRVNHRQQFATALFDLDYNFYDDNKAIDLGLINWWGSQSYTVTVPEENENTQITTINGAMITPTIDYPFIDIGTQTAGDLVVISDMGPANAAPQTFVGDGGTNLFNIGTHSTTSTFVFVNGVKQIFNTDYTFSSPNISFTTVPAVDDDIDVMEWTFESSEILSAPGNIKSITLSSTPYGHSIEKVLVFINGLLTIPVAFDPFDNSLYFDSYVPYGVNHIEVIYMEQLNGHESFTYEDTVTQYSINKNINEFYYVPETYLLPALDRIDSLLVLLSDAVTALELFSTRTDQLKIRLQESVTDLTIT